MLGCTRGRWKGILGCRPGSIVQLRFPWTWLRVHRATVGAEEAAQVLTDTWTRAHTDSAGHTWLPLDVLVGVSGTAMVAAVTEQVAAVLAALKPKGAPSDV